MGASGKGRRDRVKSGLWGGHLAAWRESGESIAGYCRRHGLLEQSFHYWKKVLSSEGGDASGTLDVGACVAGGASGPCGAGSSALTPASALFAEVRVVDATPSPELTVVLAGGRSVRVPRDFDGETLQRVVVALESLSC